MTKTPPTDEQKALDALDELLVFARLGASTAIGHGFIDSDDKAIRAALTRDNSGLYKAAHKVVGYFNFGGLKGNAEALTACGDLSAVLYDTTPPVDHSEALRGMLSKRIEWLDKERRSGGDYKHLTARLEECQYIAEKINAALGEK